MLPEVSEVSMSVTVCISVCLSVCVCDLMAIRSSAESHFSVIMGTLTGDKIHRQPGRAPSWPEQGARDMGPRLIN